MHFTVVIWVTRTMRWLLHDINLPRYIILSLFSLPIHIFTSWKQYLFIYLKAGKWYLFQWHVPNKAIGHHFYIYNYKSPCVKDHAYQTWSKIVEYVNCIRPIGQIVIYLKLLLYKPWFSWFNLPRLIITWSMGRCHLPKESCIPCLVECGAVLLNDRKCEILRKIPSIDIFWSQ